MVVHLLPGLITMLNSEPALDQINCRQSYSTVVKLAKKPIRSLDKDPDRDKRQ